MDVKEIPIAIILVIIGGLLIVALVPEIRTAVTAATAITGAAATLLNYVGLAIVAGFTLLIVAVFLTQHTRLNLKLPSQKFARFCRDTRGISLIVGVFFVVSIAITMLIAIPLLNNLADNITAATNSTGALYGTVEATLLQQWVLIIVASILLSIFAIFLWQKQS